MKRLTINESKYNRKRMICRYEDCDTSEEHCPPLNKDNCPCLQEVIEKLAEYEDLEESGRLLKLPCAVGDTVYKVYSQNKLVLPFTYKPVKIESILKIIQYMESDDFGKTVFLTKEQAESALKKMEG